LSDKTLKDDDDNPLDWNTPPADWTDFHEVALVDALVHFTGVHGEPKQVASVSNARYWPFRVEHGKVVMRKIDDGKSSEKITGGSGQSKEMLVPVLVKSDVGWVPNVANPATYGPKEERNSFTPHK
jgi:hypothetical protein